jgi:hypothetical protein
MKAAAEAKVKDGSDALTPLDLSNVTIDVCSSND